jgi:hypothetical protein
MRRNTWLLICLVAGAIALLGCGRQKPEPPVQAGVTLDLPKLQDAFASASAELQTQVSEVMRGVRYGEYAPALAALAKLEASPGLTDAQKKIVTEVTAQVKEVASKGPAAPPR